MSSRRNVSLYLIKQEKNDDFLSEIDFVEDGVPLRQGLEGWFFPISGEEKPPDWLPHVEKLLQPQANFPEMTSRQPAGFLYIKHDGRIFVITFAHGWQRLQPGWMIPDFGRRVVLNSIEPSSLIGMRSEQVFAGWHVADERAPKAAAVDSFNVQFDRDLVSVIEGRSSVKELGVVIRGGTSLRASLDFSDLPTALNLALKKYSSNDYKRNWPEIDTLAPVKDPSLIQCLDEKLNEILEGDHVEDRVVLSSPPLKEDFLDFDTSYVIGRYKQSAAKTPYLTLDGWSMYLKRKGRARSLDSAKETLVHIIDGDDVKLHKFTIYDCIGCEVQHDSYQYVFSSGNWFLADDDFIQRVNKYVSKLDASSVKLLRWDGKDHEDNYNKKCEMSFKSSKLYCLDAKNIHYGGGQSKFEFCDLIDIDNKILFFVKNPTKSSGASHLYEQVRRTVDNFFSVSSGFRNKCKEAFKEQKPEMPRGWLEDRPRPVDWTICLVSMGRSPDKFPFFAKCGLYRLVKELKGRHHKVSFQAV